jgi:uroporphyrinogen decarboxylase
MNKKTDFAGLRVAAMESRRRDEMKMLIEKFGGQAFVSPSMREVALERSDAAVDFAHRLITGDVEGVIFLTGVGFKHLLAAVEKHVDRQRFLNSLTDVVTIARGPKPVAAMKEVGIQPTHRIPEPNTWREVLAYIDQHLKVTNWSIAVQEYGKPNPSLVAGLEARGAKVLPLTIYQYDLPEDVGPLEGNVRAIAAGERDVVMFTSAHQVVNMLRVAERLGVEPALRKALAAMVVASIGPTTSEMLREVQLTVDLEPEHSKMGPLVATAAERSADVLRTKRTDWETKAATSGPARVEMVPATLAKSENLPPWYNSPFMKACRREPSDVTPVWLMRQAGRYMAEYREVRAKTGFLELCRNPKLCSEVMCTAVAKLGVDAAIIFSDLLPILEPMGLQLEFGPGEGPVIHNPIRTAADLPRFKELEKVDDLAFVFETVRQTRADIPQHIPVIGFAGAPFTLASYAVEGGGSRSYAATKALMYGDEPSWKELMERLSRSIARYLNAQIAAGAQVVQIFDSWVGCLGTDDYRRYVLPYQKMLIEQLTPGVPVINFGTGNPELLESLTECGGDVIGIDWRIRLDEAWQRVGYGKAVQGNLDPCVLLAPLPTIRKRVQEVLTQASKRPGHIFNLGHGILQQTNVDHAVALVEMVHELSTKR